MKFIDKTEIHLKAGKGGDGLCSFKSAKNKPKMGADGGDGGHGGSVYLVGKKQLNTLSCLRYRHYYKADDGVKGGSNGKTGACGKDLLLYVPIGTIIKDRETGEELGEVLEEGEKVLVGQGGRRGFGNLRYVSSTRQAPEIMIEGLKGEVRSLALELKLMADVGLAGFPNAGKSSLLSVVSSARPRVADYPFTTLVPNLGVVDFADQGDLSGKSFVMADIPGLIEGAAEGKGLGHDFLKHLERTKLLAYVVECTNIAEEDPVESYLKIKHEVDQYGELKNKPSLVIISKIDLIEDETFLTELRERFAEIGVRDLIALSSAARVGLKDAKHAIYDRLNLQDDAVEIEEDEEEIESEDLSDQWLESEEFTLMTKSDFFKKPEQGRDAGEIARS